MSAVNSIQSSSSSVRQCWTCEETDKPTKVCIECLVAAYCSKECQTNDWKNHMYNCGNFGKIKTSLKTLAIEKQKLYDIVSALRSTNDTFDPLRERQATLLSTYSQLMQQ